MDFYWTLCIVLCVVSSPASLRLHRQVRPHPFMERERDHFHFPDQPERMDRNDIFGFPDVLTRPGGTGYDGFGGQWYNEDNNRRPSGGVPHFSNNPWLNGVNGQTPGGSNSQRPNSSNQQRPNNINQQRPTTPNTTTDRTSTPRTFHLAPQGCDCPSTPQFNPVCGSDGNTYKNAGLLKCFRLCGIDVSQRRMGAC